MLYDDKSEKETATTPATKKISQQAISGTSSTSATPPLSFTGIFDSVPMLLEFRKLGGSNREYLLVDEASLKAAIENLQQLVTEGSETVYAAIALRSLCQTLLETLPACSVKQKQAGVEAIEGVTNLTTALQIADEALTHSQAFDAGKKAENDISLPVQLSQAHEVLNNAWKEISKINFKNESKDLPFTDDVHLPKQELDEHLPLLIKALKKAKKELKGDIRLERRQLAVAKENIQDLSILSDSPPIQKACDALIEMIDLFEPLVNRQAERDPEYKQTKKLVMDIFEVAACLLDVDETINDAVQQLAEQNTRESAEKMVVRLHAGKEALIEAINTICLKIYDIEIYKIHNIEDLETAGELEALKIRTPELVKKLEAAGEEISRVKYRYSPKKNALTKVTHYVSQKAGKLISGISTSVSTGRQLATVITQSGEMKLDHLIYSNKQRGNAPYSENLQRIHEVIRGSIYGPYSTMYELDRQSNALVTAMKEMKSVRGAEEQLTPLWETLQRTQQILQVEAAQTLADLALIKFPEQKMPTEIFTIQRELVSSVNKCAEAVASLLTCAKSMMITGKIGPEATRALHVISKVTHNTEYSVAELTGGSLDVFSPRARIIKHLAGALAEKTLSLGDLSPEEQKNHRLEIYEVIEELADTFEKKSDARFEGFVLRLLREYIRALAGNRVMPDSMTMVPTLLKASKKYLVESGSKRLSSTLLYSLAARTVDNALGVAFPALTVMRGVRAVIKLAITPITLTLMLSKLNHTVMPGHRLRKGSTRLTIMSQLAIAAYRIIRSFTPSLLKLIADATLTGFEVNRDGVTEVLGKASKRLPTDMFFAGIGPAALAGGGVINEIYVQRKVVLLKQSWRKGASINYEDYNEEIITRALGEHLEEQSTKTEKLPSSAGSSSGSINSRAKRSVDDQHLESDVGSVAIPAETTKISDGSIEVSEEEINASINEVILDDISALQIDPKILNVKVWAADWYEKKIKENGYQGPWPINWNAKIKIFKKRLVMSQNLRSVLDKGKEYILGPTETEEITLLDYAFGLHIRNGFTLDTHFVAPVGNDDEIKATYELMSHVNSIGNMQEIYVAHLDNTFNRPGMKAFYARYHEVTLKRIMEDYFNYSVEETGLDKNVVMAKINRGEVGLLEFNNRAVLGMVKIELGEGKCIFVSLKTRQIFMAACSVDGLNIKFDDQETAESFVKYVRYGVTHEEQNRSVGIINAEGNLDLTNRDVRSFPRGKPAGIKMKPLLTNYIAGNSYSRALIDAEIVELKDYADYLIKTPGEIQFDYWVDKVGTAGTYVGVFMLPFTAGLSMTIVGVAAGKVLSSAAFSLGLTFVTGVLPKVLQASLADRDKDRDAALIDGLSSLAGEGLGYAGGKLLEKVLLKLAARKGVSLNKLSADTPTRANNSIKSRTGQLNAGGNSDTSLADELISTTPSITPSTSTSLVSRQPVNKENIISVFENIENKMHVFKSRFVNKRFNLSHSTLRARTARYELMRNRYKVDVGNVKIIKRNGEVDQFFVLRGSKEGAEDAYIYFKQPIENQLPVLSTSSVDPISYEVMNKTDFNNRFPTDLNHQDDFIAIDWQKDFTKTRSPSSTPSASNSDGTISTSTGPNSDSLSGSGNLSPSTYSTSPTSEVVNSPTWYKKRELEASLAYMAQRPDISDTNISSSLGDSANTLSTGTPSVNMHNAGQTFDKIFDEIMKRSPKPAAEAAINKLGVEAGAKITDPLKDNIDEAANDHKIPRSEIDSKKHWRMNEHWREVDQSNNMLKFKDAKEGTVLVGTSLVFTSGDGKEVNIFNFNGVYKTVGLHQYVYNAVGFAIEDTERFASSKGRVKSGIAGRSDRELISWQNDEFSKLGENTNHGQLNIPLVLILDKSKLEGYIEGDPLLNKIPIEAIIEVKTDGDAVEAVTVLLEHQWGKKILVSAIETEETQEARAARQLTKDIEETKNIDDFESAYAWLLRKGVMNGTRKPSNIPRTIRVLLLGRVVKDIDKLAENIDPGDTTSLSINLIRFLNLFEEGKAFIHRHNIQPNVDSYISFKGLAILRASLIKEVKPDFDLVYTKMPKYYLLPSYGGFQQTRGKFEPHEKKAVIKELSYYIMLMESSEQIYPLRPELIRMLRHSRSARDFTLRHGIVSSSQTSMTQALMVELRQIIRRE